jgi:hypothetical protein
MSADSVAISPRRTCCRRLADRPGHQCGTTPQLGMFFLETAFALNLFFIILRIVLLLSLDETLQTRFVIL